MARILVLDDEKDACDLVERVLSSSHEVVSFTEEDEAIEYIKKHEVDLAILDIKLKKMSGVEVLSILREIRPDTRAVMLTGYPTVKTAELSITLGAYDYLTKPLDIEQLEAKVNHVLSPPDKSTGKGEGPELAEDLSPSD